MTTTTVRTCDGLTVATAPALTSHVRVIVRTHQRDQSPGCEPALAIFQDVNLSCSRFDPDSELRRVNADPAGWHTVSRTFSTAIREAWWAYRRTSGEFDPRLYPASQAAGTRPPWQPRFVEGAGRVHIGGTPVDIDGIARGLALRWTGRELQGTHHLVEAADSCWSSGHGPDGEPWRVGIPDPLGDPSPLAVVDVTDTACATAIAARARVAGQRVAGGLLAVTVVGPDAVAAEVWSTVLVTTGQKNIAEVAHRRRLPAAWVTDDGKLHASPLLEARMLWQR